MSIPTRFPILSIVAARSPQFAFGSRAHTDPAPVRARFLLFAALVQHARRHGRARFRQGELAWRNSKRSARSHFGRPHFCRRCAQRLDESGFRILGRYFRALDGVRGNVWTSRRRSARIQRYDVETVAHGHPARRRLDHARLRLVERWIDSIRELDGSRLDLPYCDRRLCADDDHSIETNHGGVADRSLPLN